MNMNNAIHNNHKDFLEKVTIIPVLGLFIHTELLLMLNFLQKNNRKLHFHKFPVVSGHRSL